MRFDFWNNPLVVTALRLKYRRGSPGAMSTLYLLALVGVGALFHRYWNDRSVSWIRAYLVTILAIQFVVSGIYSLMTTTNSLLLEVQQRTLDSQRIAAQSPRQILLGKMLGDPVGGYLLAISTLPLALWCSLAGACSVGVLALFYLQLATTSLLFGAMGLVQPLELSVARPGADNRGASNTRLGGLVCLIYLAFLPAGLPGVIAAGGSGSLPPATRLLAGTLTPVLGLIGLYQGTPWVGSVQFFALEIPSLLAAPCAQLAVAAFFFSGMVRKLRNPLFPLVSKSMAYLALVAIDVLIAGSLYDKRPGARPLDESTALFLGGHLLACLLLVFGSTPGKSCLLSWLWRFRRGESWLASRFHGDRSPSSYESLVLAMIGAAVWLPGIWWPAYRTGSAPPLAALDSNTLQLAAGGTLLLLALASAYQWFVLVAARGGTVAFALAAVVLVLLPALIGGYYEITWLSALTPVGQVVSRLIDDDPLPVAPYYAVYGLILLGSWRLLQRRLSAHAAIIDRKLAQMGVR